MSPVCIPRRLRRQDEMAGRRGREPRPESPHPRLRGASPAWGQVDAPSRVDGNAGARQRGGPPQVLPVRRGPEASLPPSVPSFPGPCSWGRRTRVHLPDTGSWAEIRRSLRRTLVGAMGDEGPRGAASQLRVPGWAGGVAADLECGEGAGGLGCSAWVTLKPTGLLASWPRPAEPALPSPTASGQRGHPPRGPGQDPSCLSVPESGPHADPGRLRVGGNPGPVGPSVAHGFRGFRATRQKSKGGQRAASLPAC